MGELHPIRRRNQGKNLGRYLELGERWRVIKNPDGDLRQASRGSAALTEIARVRVAVNRVIQEKAA